jgi:N-acyl homoserine lactone hydrolase
MAKMRMYILDHGVMENDKAWMVAMNKPATASNRNPGFDWISIPSLTFLIDHPAGRILYDTSCDPVGMKGQWSPFIQENFPWYCKEEELLPNRLKLIGLTPADIQHVIISHLHMDHAGNLKLFNGSSILILRWLWRKYFMLRLESRASIGGHLLFKDHEVFRCGSCSNA